MKAMVLAAGLGTRLRPLTYEIPKPMVPVLDRPVMAHIVGLLEGQGFDELIANLHYYPDTIQAYFGDRLEYRFENPTVDSTTAVLSWEKLAVPIPIQVDTKAVVFASLKSQLRGLPRFFWQGWNQAAQWTVANDYELDQGLAWADQSIGAQRTFANLRTKAAILEKKGDTKAAQDLRDQAMKIATEADVNVAGYQLLGQQKVDEAIVLFRKNIKDHPDSWNTYDSLGEALAAKGDKKAAIESYNKALSMTNDPVQKKRINDILVKLKPRSERRRAGR